jgi:2-hydroxychromene-2-carboxylate isomerase
MIESFDRWQFDNRPVRLSRESEIDWNDYHQMHSEHHGPGEGKKRWTPRFASDNEKVRAVLLAIGWRLLHGNAPQPADVDWQELNRQCTDYVLGLKIPEYQKYTTIGLQRAVRHAGSYLGYHAGVVNFFWREGLDSATVASVMDVSPTQVRQVAWRMRTVAVKLGFEIARPKISGPATNLRRRNAARRATLRRRLYGSPEFIEGKHCWNCKVNLVAEGNKWHCANCAAEEAHAARQRWRRKHGLPVSGPVPRNRALKHATA